MKKNANINENVSRDILIADVLQRSISGGGSQVFCNKDGYCGVCGCGPDICGLGCGPDWGDLPQ